MQCKEEYTRPECCVRIFKLETMIMSGGPGNAGVVAGGRGEFDGGNSGNSAPEIPANGSGTNWMG